MAGEGAAAAPAASPGSPPAGLGFNHRNPAVKRIMQARARAPSGAAGAPPHPPFPPPPPF
jgi:hypothetical protein